MKMKPDSKKIKAVQNCSVQRDKKKHKTVFKFSRILQIFYPKFFQIGKTSH